MKDHAIKMLPSKTLRPSGLLLSWMMLLLLLPSSKVVIAYSVFILRHGQTDANAGGLIQGSSDFSRLTDLGKQQAATVAIQVFREMPPIGSLYVSRLTPAKETLKVLRRELIGSSKLPLATAKLKILREIDFYNWESRHKDDLKREFPDSWKAWKAGDPHNLVVFSASKEMEWSHLFTASSPPEDELPRHPLLELWERADHVWDETTSRKKRSGNIYTKEACSSTLHCILGTIHGAWHQRFWH
jgi:broad specificity phosphatase PhoE